MELSDFLAMDVDLKELKVAVSEHLGINLHKNATTKTVIDAVKKHYAKDEQIGNDDGWVKVRGLVDAYVGTGYPGVNKLFLGQEVDLPILIARPLLDNKQVKEIK